MLHTPTLTWQERPFGPANHVLIEAPGRGLPMPTILEVINATPGLPRGFVQGRGQVRINGDLVPREAWGTIRPKPHPVCPMSVTLHMPLHSPGGGAGGGGKQTAALVATIAVLLAATAVTAGGAAGFGLLGFSGIGTLAPQWLAAGSLSALVAGASIGIGGKLHMSARFPGVRK